MRTLVTGWFSFEEMGATAGDLMARDVACEWLAAAGRAYDVALAAPFAGGVDWRSVEPSAYSELLFVCGPFGNGPPVSELLERFRGARLIGLDLSMLEPLEAWNPFDLLIERDSTRRAHPDLSLLNEAARVPVAGLVLIDTQPEYGERGLHADTNERLRCLADERGLAAVPIDTRLDVNTTGLRSATQIEAVIARMDVVLTTRLHGLVLSIKGGVPPVVVDPVAGGAKVRRQAETLGWPLVFAAELVRDEELHQALDYALSSEGRVEAARCRTRAVERLRRAREEFVREMALL